MVEGIRKASLMAEMSARQHTILSGLAEKLGGGDEAPDPHELLEAALAACTILTGQLYAGRKGYKLDSIDVAVKVEAEGAESRISRRVSYRGALSAEEKARLTEIVGRCPIHRLLQSKISIETIVE